MTEKEFVQKHLARLQQALSRFPEAFLGEQAVKDFTLPDSRLNLGEELFGSYELIDSAGNTLHTARDIYEAKYLVYSSQHRHTIVPVPVNHSGYQAVTSAYERYIDNILKELISDYQKLFPAGKNAMAVVNEILRVLGLVRF
ncbi:MAG: hypothetical protein HYV28_19930 [Ignavibacteriales bacterium]|nr:hypothetical protein [Ignavibacteriales bacterium]